jgi:hypothetical protein
LISAATEFGELAELVGELQIARRFLRDDVERDCHPSPARGRARSVPKIDSSTISSVSSLMSSVTLTSSPRAAWASHLAMKRLLQASMQLRELGDHAAVEHRLHHVTLAFPQLAFAGHDAVAEQDLDPVQSPNPWCSSCGSRPARA